MDEPETRQTQTAKIGTRRRGKSIFVIAVVLMATLLYWLQRTEPDLLGWDDNFEQALAEAKKTQKPKVLIFFTTSPMGRVDKVVATGMLRSTKTRSVLEKLGYPKVHLTTSSHRDLAKRYGVQETPTYLLVDPAGKLLKKETGKLTDIVFCTNFLESSIDPSKPAPKP